ncbi:MAG: chemotaxis protein CheW [Pseudomonadales bacterium]|jgi:twitching motility protein PilI|nr:chemotaxis protein CheW [Pseudomonadales bacterium]
MSAAVDAFAQLRALERGALTHALPLPAQEQVSEQWRGLGFSLGGTRLVAAVGEVVEVLGLQGVTRVPRTRAWVMGVANVRGRLLPIVDLAEYLDVEHTGPRNQRRVLVVEDGELFCGLLVEQSFGMMQFELQEYDESRREPAPGRLDGFLKGAFRLSGRPWRVMDLRSLVREPAFFEVAG